MTTGSPLLMAPDAVAVIDPPLAGRFDRFEPSPTNEVAVKTPTLSIFLLSKMTEVPDI